MTNLDGKSVILSWKWSAIEAPSDCRRRNRFDLNELKIAQKWWVNEWVVWVLCKEAPSSVLLSTRQSSAVSHSASQWPGRSTRRIRVFLKREIWPCTRDLETMGHGRGRDGHAHCKNRQTDLLMSCTLMWMVALPAGEIAAHVYRPSSFGLPLRRRSEEPPPSICKRKARFAFKERKKYSIQPILVGLGDSPRCHFSSR